jgi:hypothetical protein
MLSLKQRIVKVKQSTSILKQLQPSLPQWHSSVYQSAKTLKHWMLLLKQRVSSLKQLQLSLPQTHSSVKQIASPFPQSASPILQKTSPSKKITWHPSQNSKHFSQKVTLTLSTTKVVLQKGIA